MAASRSWHYYQFASVTGSHPTRYYRLWRGITDRLDPDARGWVAVDPAWFSRSLEHGAAGLDRTTRAAIEAAVGFPLPG